MLLTWHCPKLGPGYSVGPMRAILLLASSYSTQGYPLGLYGYPCTLINAVEESPGPLVIVDGPTFANIRSTIRYDPMKDLARTLQRASIIGCKSHQEQNRGRYAHLVQRFVCHYHHIFLSPTQLSKGSQPLPFPHESTHG